MSQKMLHSPEGVRDLYGRTLIEKRALSDALFSVMDDYGYQPIETPSFEYFDVFSGGLKTMTSRNLFKFFDREGNTLALRPDITPSIVRSAAMYFEGAERPLRLCYQGNVFVNHSSHQGRLRESSQMGAELIGDGSLSADAEMVLLSLACLKRCGVPDAVIALGHAGLAAALAREASLTGEETEALRHLVHRHNRSGLKKLLKGKALPEGLAPLFGLLTGVYASPAEWTPILETAGRFPAVREALDRLCGLYALLEEKKAADRISLAPGMGYAYEYYTGLVFAGYLAGSGTPVVTGGRYDDVLANFGAPEPAIGMAVHVDALSNAVLMRKENERKRRAANEGADGAQDGTGGCQAPDAGSDEKTVLYPVDTETEASADAKENRKSWVTVALAKGRLAKTAMKKLSEAGIRCDEMTDPSTRKLLFVNEEHKLRFFLAKASDVPTYVEYGAADLGIVGLDTIAEEDRDVFEVLDLGFGACRMCVCGPPEARGLLDSRRQLVVATKYPAIARDYFIEKRRQTVELIKLNGSVELAPIVGLSDVIVDIVETGSTLRENGLQILEEILPLSARVITNRVSMILKYKQIAALLDAFEASNQH